MYYACALFYAALKTELFFLSTVMLMRSDECRKSALFSFHRQIMGYRESKINVRGSFGCLG